MSKHPLRRLILSAAATVSGIVLLLSLKPHTPPDLAGPPAPPPSVAPPTPSASPSPAASKESTSAKPSKKPSSASPKPSSKAARAPSPTKASSTPAGSRTGSDSGSTSVRTRTVSGSTVQTKYGPVQVQITVSGGRITAATALQQPNHTARSKDINARAIPVLNQETLAAQSADIDTVSGATYTSSGYRKSLQSALDRAGG